MKQTRYCQVHNKFQTQNGRWLDAGHNQEEMNKHTLFIGSSVVDDICDECDDPNQIEVVFEEVENHPDFKSAYDLMLASGMFWEFHPELDGIWELDKDVFIAYHN